MLWCSRLRRPLVGVCSEFPLLADEDDNGLQGGWVDLRADFDSLEERPRRLLGLGDFADDDVAREDAQPAGGQADVVRPDSLAKDMMHYHYERVRRVAAYHCAFARALDVGGNLPGGAGDEMDR